MSLLLAQLDKEGSVLLESYGHQVGGHHLLFKFKDTLCKAVLPREHFFYATAPDRIKRHIPAYYGLINVSFVKQSSGEIQVIATRKEQQPIALPTMAPPLPGIPKCTTGKTIHSDGVTLISGTMGNGDAYVNPWATMCTKIMELRLNQLGSRLKDISADYMILENLTPKFHSPSILDLKVGTRQHGDDATPSKVLKHTYTCTNSTSKSLGVRMAGMQKFDKLRNKYIFYDKYFGKQLSEEGFAKVLHFFLDNGVCFRSDLVMDLIRMLKDLQASIRNLPSFRFFSSSLLLIYDGAVCPENLCRSTPYMDMKDVPTSYTDTNDAHVPYKDLKDIPTSYKNEKNAPISNRKTTVEGKSTVEGKTTVEGKNTVEGKTTVEEKTMIEGKNTVEGKNTIEEKNTVEGKGTVEASPVSLSAHCHNTSNNVMSQEELDEVRCHIDLRMIDFAHSTHTGFTNDPVTYDDPDEGYLIGLKSLITIFQEMETCRT